MLLILDMDNPEILHLLNNYSDYTFITNPIMGAFFTLFGFLVKVLYYASSALEEIFDKIFLVFGFMGDSGLFSGIHLVFLTIGGICLLGSILYLGYMYVLGYKVDIKNVVRNIVLTVVIFGLIPAITSTVGSVVGDSNRQIQAASSSGGTSNGQDKMSLQPLKANIHDFLWIKAKGFPDWEDSPEHIQLTDKKIPRLNLGEIIPNDNKWYDNFINLSAGDGDKDKLFQYEGSEDVTGENTKFTDYHKIPKSAIQNLENGWMRYKVYFLPLLLQQVLLICLFGFTFLKLVRLGTEMIVIQQYVPVIAFSDIHDGSKIKAVFQTVINSVIVMILICANLRIFLIISQAVNVYLSSLGGDQMIKNLTYTFFQIGIFLAIVSGVGIVERLFGISTNMKSEALGAGVGVAVAGNILKSMFGGLGNGAQKVIENHPSKSGNFTNNDSNTENPNLNETPDRSPEGGRSAGDRLNDNAGTREPTNSENTTNNNSDNPNLNVGEEATNDSAETNVDNPNLNPTGENLDNPNVTSEDSSNDQSENPNLTPDTGEGKDNFENPNEGVDGIENPNLSNNEETNDSEPQNDCADNSNNENLNHQEDSKTTKNGHSTKRNTENPNLGENNSSGQNGNPHSGENNAESDRNNSNVGTEDSTNKPPSNKGEKRLSKNPQNKRKHKSAKNILGDAMIRNQAIDDEGQTKGKPLSEDLKEY